MTNAAAIGYMILAAKQLDFDYEMTKCLENLMIQEMDITTEDEAEDVYKKISRRDPNE